MKKRFKGYGVVWDAENNRPLADFTGAAADGDHSRVRPSFEPVDFITDDDAVIQKLEALGYVGDEVEEVPETHEDAPQGENALEAMSYSDLKELATEKGIEFHHNIKRTDLIALIESHE